MVLACRTSFVEVVEHWNFARQCLLFMSIFLQSIGFPCVGSQICLVDPNYWIHNVGDSLENAICHMNKCIYSTSFILKLMVYMSFQVHNLFDFCEYQI